MTSLTVHHRSVHTGDMSEHTNTKTVYELQVGDEVHSIGDTTFTETHTVTRVVEYQGRAAVVYATGGAFWPTNNGLGPRIAVVS